MDLEFQLGSVIIRDGDENGVIYYHTRQDKYFDESGEEISLTEADRRVREESGFLMLDSIVVEDAIAGLKKIDESKNTQDPEKARLLFLQGMEFLGKANVHLVDDWETQAFTNYRHVFSSVEDMRHDMEEQLQIGRTQIPSQNPTRLGRGAIMGFSTERWLGSWETGSRVGGGGNSGGGWLAAATAIVLGGAMLWKAFKKPDPTGVVPELLSETTPITEVDVGTDWEDDLEINLETIPGFNQNLTCELDDEDDTDLDGDIEDDDGQQYDRNEIVVDPIVASAEGEESAGEEASTEGEGVDPEEGEVSGAAADTTTGPRSAGAAEGEEDIKTVDLGPAINRILDSRGRNVSNLNDKSLEDSSEPFRGIKLTREQILTLYRLGVRNFAGADLRDANLEWANLEWANLRGANLKGAIIDDKTRFSFFTGLWIRLRTMLLSEKD